MDVDAVCMCVSDSHFNFFSHTAKAKATMNSVFSPFKNTTEMKKVRRDLAANLKRA